jgi:hypothetical protein
MAKLTPEQQAAYDTWLDAYQRAWDETQPALAAVRKAEAAASHARDEYLRLEDEVREVRFSHTATKAYTDMRRAAARVRDLGIPFPAPE